MTHLYGEPFHRRLRELGVEAVAFREGAYFGARSNQILSLSARAQRKYRLGPSVDRLNSDLVKAARSLAVHAVFEREVTVEAAHKVFEAQPSVVLVDDPAAMRFPTPADVVGEDAVVDACRPWAWHRARSPPDS